MVIADTPISLSRDMGPKLLSYLGYGSAVAGSLFVISYALGMIALSTFFGRYGLQVTDLLRVRYVSLGLTAIVMLAPMLGWFLWAFKEAPRFKARPLRNRLALAGMVFVFATATIVVVWFLWLNTLTRYGAALPGSMLVGMVASAAGIGLICPYILLRSDAATWVAPAVVSMATIVMAIGIATTLANLVPYLPPWAGGLPVGRAQVLIRDPELQSVLAGRVVVVDASQDRYVFWVQADGTDRLVEVPSSLVIAVIGERSAPGSPDNGK